MRFNDLVVDQRLASLMQRPDWAGKRTSKAWLDRFPVHPQNSFDTVPFVEFIPPDSAALESKQLRKPKLATLLGTPSIEYPPGNLDPTAAYIIGFVDIVDSPICVDLRPPGEPRITYDNFGPRLTHATAFESLEEFVRFFVEQHGESSSA